MGEPSCHLLLVAWTALMSTPPQPGPPPGWYDDQRMVGPIRYWNGNSWTDHVAPMHQGLQLGRDAAGDDSGLIAAGFILAILMPIIGFIIGIVLLAKSQAGPGVGCLVVSVIAFFVWTSVLFSASHY